LQHIFIKIINIIKFINNINKLKILSTKIYRRIFDTKNKIPQSENLNFIENNISSINDFLISVDKKLFYESLKFSKELNERAIKKLITIPHDLGGGGAYILLYFLTRYLKPKVILETGVAAGFSSQSFLKAIQKNKIGKLYSSDFPYFRISNPEKYIGILIEENLKENWQLGIEGDFINIKSFLKRINTNINLVHYDSDKSYNGREKVFNLINSKIDENTFIIIDDIQDNSYFIEYINKNKILNWKIFKFEFKYLGLILSNDFYKKL
jgi:predicted O-methyltransferase YrrM